MLLIKIYHVPEVLNISTENVINLSKLIEKYPFNIALNFCYNI